MSESKLPNMNDLKHMAEKLFKEVKDSVCGIIEEFKEKQVEHKTETKAEEKTAESEAAKPKKAAKKAADDKKED